jgi:asparagine synthase (glutamine-hydrolysing)
MCGIAGLLNINSAPVKTEKLLSMINVLAHRGPDGDGIWTQGPVGLGHRRLAIRDLSNLGQQPMSDPRDHAVISYNGEIYNDIELKREIERETGYKFRSTCDTEVILAGWLAWKESLFDRLNGMYALAIWDALDKRLILARDPAGIKPLYVYQSETLVAFSSEIKGLLPILSPLPSLDRDAFMTFLSLGYTGAEKSLLDGVQALPPGSLMSFDKLGYRKQTFWQPTRNKDIKKADEAVSMFLDIWPNILESTMISDVPIGVLQSGGIDSSLISMGLSKTKRLKLFTASFGSASYDESSLALQIQNASGAESTNIEVGVGEGLEDTFTSVVHHFDGQVADSSGIALYKLCEQVKRHVSVALTGDGADEYFAGYSTYSVAPIAALMHKIIPRKLASSAGQICDLFGGKKENRLPLTHLISRFLLSLSEDIHPHCQFRRLVPAHLLRDICGPEVTYEYAQKSLLKYDEYVRNNQGNTIDRCMLADQQYYLPADLLMKTDAMSMAHGLELRVPFLTREIIELAGSIDTKLLISWSGKGKQVLRSSLELLGGPLDVVRAPKLGFQIPVDQWLRGALRPLGDRLFSKDVDRLEPFLSPIVVRNMWRDHLAMRRSNGYALWPILTFATWLEILPNELR